MNTLWGYHTDIRYVRYYRNDISVFIFFKCSALYRLYRYTHIYEILYLLWNTFYMCLCVSFVMSVFIWIKNALQALFLNWIEINGFNWNHWYIIYQFNRHFTRVLPLYVFNWTYLSGLISVLSSTVDQIMGSVRECGS